MGFYPPIEDGLKLMIDPISGKPEALCFPSHLLYQEDLLNFRDNCCESSAVETANLR